MSRSKKPEEIKRDTNKSYLFILDCNIWISILLSPKESKLLYKIQTNDSHVILTSYTIIEILRVLKRIAIKESRNYDELQSLFWDYCNQPWIIKDINEKLSESLLQEVKRSPEYSMIAKLLQLEIKDVPYIVSAYQHQAKFITNDIRSLVLKRDKIHQYLQIDIYTEKEFIEKK